MTTVINKRRIGAEWTGKPDTDSYRSFLQRADPERAAREERERLVADLMQRASYGYDEMVKAEQAGNAARAAKFTERYYLRIEQLDALQAMPLLFWCSSCTPSESCQDEAQGALDGMDDRLPHALCLDHLDAILRDRAARRAQD